MIWYLDTIQNDHQNKPNYLLSPYKVIKIFDYILYAVHYIPTVCFYSMGMISQTWDGKGLKKKKKKKEQPHNCPNSSSINQANSIFYGCIHMVPIGREKPDCYEQDKFAIKNFTNSLHKINIIIFYNFIIILKETWQIKIY